MDAPYTGDTGPLFSSDNEHYSDRRVCARVCYTESCEEANLTVKVGGREESEQGC